MRTRRARSTQSAGDAMRALVAELGAAAPAGVGALHPLLVQREVRNVGVLLVTGYWNELVQWLQVHLILGAETPV